MSSEAESVEDRIRRAAGEADRWGDQVLATLSKLRQCDDSTYVGQNRQKLEAWLKHARECQQAAEGRFAAAVARRREVAL